MFGSVYDLTLVRLGVLCCEVGSLRDRGDCVSVIKGEGCGGGMGGWR